MLGVVGSVGVDGRRLLGRVVRLLSASLNLSGSSGLGLSSGLLFVVRVLNGDGGDGLQRNDTTSGSTAQLLGVDTGGTDSTGSSGGLAVGGVKALGAVVVEGDAVDGSCDDEEEAVMLERFKRAKRVGIEKEMRKASERSERGPQSKDLQVQTAKAGSGSKALGKSERLALEAVGVAVAVGTVGLLAHKRSDLGGEEGERDEPEDGEENVEGQDSPVVVGGRGSEGGDENVDADDDRGDDGEDHELVAGEREDRETIGVEAEDDDADDELGDADKEEEVGVERNVLAASWARGRVAKEAEHFVWSIRGESMWWW